MIVACRKYERDERCIQNLVRKPERKKPHGRCRCRFEDNIKMYHKEVCCESVTGFNWLRIVSIGGFL
jgi:hypothetical protein